MYTLVTVARRGADRAFGEAAPPPRVHARVLT
jgi:hypothetical protein